MRASVAAIVGMFAAALVLSAAGAAAGQAPGAASTALVIDVQVVDREGRPLPGIAPDRFEVEVGGRKRKVISAASIDAASAPAADGPDGRPIYFIVIDALTFGSAASGAAAASTTAFIETLPAQSRLGLVTFPQGPAVEPTTDHASVVAALSTLAGQRQSQRSGQFGVGLSDVVEYSAALDREAITQSFCGADLAQENACPQILEQEVNTAVNGLEAQARASLGMLTDFSTRLAGIPGRKVLVFATAGLPVGERSGTRPDVGNMPTILAESATRADVAFYTLLFDRLQEEGGSARRPSNPSRDRDLLGRWLDQFSTSMGGALVRVLPGQGGDAYARIARETASYYQIAVESTDGDSGERPQRLRVRVDQRGATVRSRQWVKGR